MKFHEYRELIKADRRNSNGRGHFSFYLLDSGYRVVVNYRRCQLLKTHSENNFLGKIFYNLQRIRYHHLCIKYGCDITSHTQIGAGLCIYHPFGIVVNPDTIIGKNVELGAHVVIGRTKGLSPVIEDGVSIGANATIIGGIRIGKNATVGAGAVVTDDVPENAIVIGNKAHVLRIKEI